MDISSIGQMSPAGVSIRGTIRVKSYLTPDARNVSTAIWLARGLKTSRQPAPMQSKAAAFPTSLSIITILAPGMGGWPRYTTRGASLLADDEKTNWSSS